MTTSAIRAKRVAGEILGAVIDAHPGTEYPNTKPLDEHILCALIRGAHFFQQCPETAEAAWRIREIAFRYNRGRPNAQQWRSDHEFAHRLDAEMMRSLIDQ